MDYEILETKEGLILRNIENFNPKHIFECGQAFRWVKEEDGSYTTVAYGKVLNVSKKDSDIILKNTNIDDFNSIWSNYFDLDTNYKDIQKKLSKDPILKKAIEFGSGIRILNQEPFETIISFIISANNQIPRIKNSIEIISREYGDFIEEYNGRSYYSFPDPSSLAKVDVEELRKVSKVGFRDKRIVETSKLIAKEDIKLDHIYKVGKNDGKDILMDLPGVGPKVSECILLFSYNKGDAFPVDVWVKRVMEYFYAKEELSFKKIEKLGEKLFGDLAGYAQQYLFYYARELEIGK